MRRISDMIRGLVTELSDTANAMEELYRVVFRTEPGDALFEATVRRLTGSVDDVFDVDSRQISRTNAYGRQPHCVMESYPHLRPYCYCIVQEVSDAPDNIQ